MTVLLGAGIKAVRHFTDLQTSIALIKNEIRIVQASLLGSILANLLLVSFEIVHFRYC
jgi:hypothetical protein